MSETFNCPHQEYCCSKKAMKLSYEEQLTQKKQRVAEVFARYPLLSPKIAGCAAANPNTAYRTRAKLVVGPKGEIGMFTEGSHRVVDLPLCLVLSPMMRDLANAVREELATFRVTPYSAERGIGLLRGIDIRQSTLEKTLHLTLILNANELPLETEALADSLLTKMPNLIGVAANLNPAPSPQFQGPQTIAVKGKQHLWEQIETAKLRYSPGTFTQAHKEQAAHMLRRVKALLQPTREEVLLDLYSGVGMFSLSMVNNVNSALLVESFAKAAEDSQEAIRDARASHLNVISSSVEDALRELPSKGRRIAVVNPPRRGLSPDVMAQLGRISPEKLVYVSCDPDTLARDIAQLSQLGLRLAAPLEPIDMIPLTEEVETLALLRRAAPAPIPILYQDEDFIAVDKPWGISIHKNQEDKDDITTRLSGQIGQQLHPVHRLDRDTSGIALFARSPEATKALNMMLANNLIEREYIALAKGITRPRGNINRPLKEQGKNIPARTRYKRLAVVANHSLLVIDLETGRNHQIRRHLEGLGHPIVGDERYGHQPTNRHFSERYGLIRPFLHAHRVAFIHPATKEVVKLRSPLPGDLATLMARAGDVTLADQLNSAKA
jgi:23S rRNA (uracil1939-C5)-methyltransferase